MKHSANNQYGKRFLSVLLLIAMLFSLFPGAAWAEDSEDPGQSNVAESESSTQSADDATQPQPETQPAPQAETQLQPTLEPTTAPTESTQEATTAPTESVQKPTTAPTESAQETTAAPTESAQEATTAPTESAQETTAAPTESAQETTAAPTESIQAATTAPTETVPAAETEPAQPKTTEPTAPSEEPTPTVRYRVEFYFEHSDSKDSDNPNNYSRVESAQLENTRTALAGTEVTASDADRRIADEAWLFDAQRASDREESPFTGTYQDYKERSPFFGFDFDHAESTVAAADGSSVLKLYYRREIWSITLYKYSKDAAENEVYVTLSGKFRAAAEYPASEELAELYASENGTFSGFFAPEDGSPASLLFNTESTERSHQVSYYPCFEAAELPPQGSEPEETEETAIPTDPAETEEAVNPGEAPETEETENPTEPPETAETQSPDEVPETAEPVENEAPEEGTEAEGNTVTAEYSVLETEAPEFSAALAAPLSETGGEESGENGDPTAPTETPQICELKIRYVTPVYSADGTSTTYVDIHPTYHIQLPQGYTYEQASPTVDNYALSDLDDAVISGTLTETYREILVVYKESAGTAKYTVNYWTQNVDGSELTKLENLCYEGEGEVGTTVTVRLPSVPGYSWSNDDLLVYITADGHAVKNVYYVKSEKRKLVFRTGTGYAQVVEANPGDDITVARAAIRDHNPTKPGYQFVNWDTSIASLGEQTLYYADGTVQGTYSCYVSASDSSDGKDHYYMPANDYVINAIWTESATPYQVVFWFEKADGSGYSNGGMDTTRYALTGTEVTAAYYDKLIVDEKTLFGAEFDNAIQSIAVDDNGNAYNFTDVYSQPAKDAEGNVLNDANGNPVVISYTNAYTNPQGKTYAEYKTMPFFGFDFDHCNDVVVTADGHATLNVYYKRETWTIKVYKKPSGTSVNETWRTIEGRYGSVAPAVGTGEADDMNKLPTYDVAKAYYDANKPDGTSASFRDLRTKSDKSGTSFNLGTQQIFNTENSNGTHVYSVYPFYNDDATAKSRRVFYGANLVVTIDNTPNLDADYVNFATSSSNLFNGKIQATFIFDESRTRAWTWEGAMFRYRSCEANTSEDQITEEWSEWETVDTTPRSVNTEGDALENEIEEGKGTIILWEDGTAYWYFHNYETKRDFYLQVILPRKKLNLNYVSHNEVVKNEHVECGAPLTDYYTYQPDDTATERFLGWYKDAEMTQPVDESDVMGYANDSIYAKWESKQCIVTFDPRNGDTVTKVAYTLGETVNKPADPEKTGFRFVGWYTEEGSHYLFMGELSGDLALHAVWEPVNMVEYTVKHILKHSDNTEVLILEETKYDSAHKTVTVNALTNEQMPAFPYGNLYVVPLDETSHSQSIDLSTEGQHLVIFYYKEMTEWPYTVTYLDIDDKTTKIQDDLTQDTDLLTIVVNAPTLTTTEDGVEKTWVPVRKVGERLSPALAGAALTPGGKNLITIYYDELHTLRFDLQGGSSVGSIYNPRSLIKQETTTIPAAPTKSGCIFLNWSEKEDGTGNLYYPGNTYTMPDKDVTLYAQWAEVTPGCTQGRLLDLQTGSSQSVTIAQNGTVTAWFTLTAQEGRSTIDLTRLKLRSETNFPAGTVITLITDSGYYYYKGGGTASIPLTSFTEMGRTTKFTGGKVSSFHCQACVEYPSGSGSTGICLTATENFESQARLDVTFSGSIAAPAGAVAVGASIGNSGSLNTTVTVSGLANLMADQSDCRHTHGTLADSGAVLAITLKDGDGKAVPFPENSTLSLNGTSAKAAGQVAGVVIRAVENGSYGVVATGLPTDKEITVCFDLCAADSANVSAQVYHPERLKLASASVKLPYTPAPEYAIRATLDSKLSRVFAVPTTAMSMNFNVSYAPANNGELPTVKAYVKSGGSYTEVSGWTASVAGSNGAATAAVTVPAGAPPGTYRITFTIGTAQYHYNLIITSD